jgi:hypothetical protein
VSAEDRESDQYLRQARERIKRRSGAWMALIIGPAIVLLAAVKVLEPHDYPAGDFRNEPLFWIAFGFVVLALVGTMMIGSIRMLLRGESDESSSG